MVKLIYLKSAYKSNSSDVSIGIKIPFFRVSVTIEPDRSLLTIRYHELFDQASSIIINNNYKAFTLGKRARSNTVFGHK